MAACEVKSSSATMVMESAYLCLIPERMCSCSRKSSWIGRCLLQWQDYFPPSSRGWGRRRRSEGFHRIHIIGLVTIGKVLQDQSSIIGLSFNCKEQIIIEIVFVAAVLGGISDGNWRSYRRGLWRVGGLGEGFLFKVSLLKKISLILIV